MITNLTEGKIQTRLIISVGVAAIIVMGIGSHAAFAVKVKKNSFQDGYNAGFAAGKKDRIRDDNEFDSKPPKGHSDAYDEGYRRGYDDAWFRGEHFSSNSAAASSSAAAVDSDGGQKHKDSAAASSSAAAAAGGASAAASSSAAATGGRSAAASSSSATSN
jgi:hypothetical protein